MAKTASASTLKIQNLEESQFWSWIAAITTLKRANILMWFTRCSNKQDGGGLSGL